ncbi:MAG: NAD-binding protein [Deltaproteobacteria bacterium]|nr:NAD-binding protein [Deltaproteobacteria bacterium]
MRFLVAQLIALLRQRPVQQNARVMGLFLFALATMLSIFAVLFHVIMAMEGQDHTWFTGFYWALTVMSTLGFGDITFHTDLGRLFSMVVLISGTVFLLVLFPFIVIQFFWAPWMNAQAAARAPRALAEETADHVILTHYDEVSAALIERLEHRQIDYVLLVPNREEAGKLHDRGLRVAVGMLDDPESWERVRARQAGLVATTCNDFTNTNAAFTVRGVAPDVPIIATADDPASVDILELAGCTHVLQLAEELGQALARRTIGADAMTHTIGEFGPLAIAEATAARTPLVGKTLAETRLRQITGLNVVGVWERGRFQSALGSTRITAGTVLVLAGTRDQLFRYDELFVIYNVSAAPVLILGGGRVGQATGRALAERDIDYRIVEKNPALVGDPKHHVLGSAAEIEVIEKAGIMETPTVIITTNDDDLNVYLTIYCRRLRPDVQVITRASVDRNVATLHRAGTDFVMSYASMGANTMLNMLKRGEILMLAEGLDLFKLPMPKSLAGRSVAEAQVRERSGVSIVAVIQGDDIQVNPDPLVPLPDEAEILLIGSEEAEAGFLDIFAHA